ncbi:MAG: hypothetical protein IJO73_02725 [Clostridia bacterium]|nr:hypothetical protein [Clostridia bacterium]
MKKILAFILSAVMIFTLTVTPASAIDIAEVKTAVTDVLCKALAFVFEGLVNGIVAPIREGDNFISEEEYLSDSLCGGLYDGTDLFLSEAPADARWSLGSASASLVPEDWETYSDLYLGGYMSTDNYMSNDVREILDDMRVRVIAMSDGTGRGTAVFATIDSIGLGNSDVEGIRRMLDGFAQAKGINSINIFTTHSHSGIDTQGLWTDIIGTWPFAFIKGYTGMGDYYGGTSDRYMAFLYEKVSLAIEAAVADMEEGTLVYAEKDFGTKYASIDNRPSADALDGRIKRFTFTPDSGSTPTVIVNMAAHPSTAGMATGSADDLVKGHGVSGDYVYYMGEVINGAGYDFMFFNGAICGIYTDTPDVNTDRRVDKAAAYGKEMGKITLALTMTQTEIEADSYLMGLSFTEEELAGRSYTPWYEGWTPVTERQVAPLLNIKLKNVEVQITNPVILLAAKLKLVNYTAKKTESGDCFITTEIGYMELGEDLKIAFVPGEFCADLAYGGSSLRAENSARGRDFSEQTLAELFGEDILVFGMANDAVGYIVPDNDYLMCIDFGHYHETISLGQSTASTLMKGFAELRDEIG